MSETFTFDVAFATSFEQLESLRDGMLNFLKAERRDYQPAFDVVVVGMFLLCEMFVYSRRLEDFPDQEKMVLRADIKYKSNCQQAGMRGTPSFIVCLYKHQMAI
jgi:hypothetical protein